MKLQKVKIKEFKILKDVNIDANGSNILLLGDNGVGKSSVIQFIEIALGKKTHIPPNATGSGEIVTLANGQEYTYQVEFKNNKPVITVLAPNGLKDSRKSVLASLVGAMDFDIDQFIEMSRTSSGRDKQIAIFKSFLPIDTQEELTKHELAVKASYDERTELNRQIKMLDAEIKTDPLYAVIHFENFEKVDFTQIYEDLEMARNHNKKIADISVRLDLRIESIEAIESEIEQLQQTIIDKKNEVIKLNKTNVEAQKWLDENPETEIKEMEKRISDANEINARHAASLLLRKKLENIETYKDDSGEMTALIDSSKQAIKDAIKDFDTPVPGLEYDIDGLKYNGFPVHPDSLSTAEIGHLGIKLKMAENPELGILFIQNGQNYGTKRLKQIQEYGWQIIMEQVERGQEELTIKIETE